MSLALSFEPFRQKLGRFPELSGSREAAKTNRETFRENEGGVESLRGFA
jgi:hypothetical protein